MSILSTDDNSTSLSEDAAEAVLLKSLDGPSGGDDGNDDDDAGGHDASHDDDHADDQGGDDSPEDDDGDDQGTEGNDEKPDAAAQAINDDAEVEVTVNGEAQKFTVGALKRLAGQEAALTQKSQEAELVGGRAAAALQAAITMAEEDLTPYANVDWLVLQGQLDPETFEWHRDNARKAANRYEQLMGAAQNFEETIKARRDADNKRAAEACAQEMAADVPGWNDTLRGEIEAYGAKEGLDAADLKAINNPKVLKLLRKAMLFDKGQAVATQKVRQAPTNVLKGAGADTGPNRAANVRKAEQRLARSGSDADAMSVLMGRWGA